MGTIEDPPIHHFTFGGTRIFGEENNSNSGMRVASCFERLFSSTQKITLGNKTVHINKKRLQKFLEAMPADQKTMYNTWIKNITAQISRTEWGLDALVGACRKASLTNVQTQELENATQIVSHWATLSSAERLEAQKKLEALYRDVYKQPSIQERHRVIKEARECIAVIDRLIALCQTDKSDEAKRLLDYLQRAKPLLRKRIKQAVFSRDRAYMLTELSKLCTEVRQIQYGIAKENPKTTIEEMHTQLLTLQKKRLQALVADELEISFTETDKPLDAAAIIAYVKAVDPKKIPIQGEDLREFGIKLYKDRMVINLEIHPLTTTLDLLNLMRGTNVTYCKEDPVWDGKPTITVALQSPPPRS